jgi:hypothetical protein
MLIAMILCGFYWIRVKNKNIDWNILPFYFICAMQNKHNAQRANMVMWFGAKISNAMSDIIIDRLTILIQIDC